MGVDGATRLGAVALPHSRRKLSAGEDRLRLGGENAEQVELFPCQPNRLVMHEYVATSAIDVQGVMLDDWRSGQRWAGSPHDRLATGNQFAEPIRFDDVVVEPCLQPENPVQLGAAGCDGDNRCVADGADSPADFEAIEIGKLEVEKHQVGTVVLSQRISSRTHRVGIVTLPPQGTRKRFT